MVCPNLTPSPSMATATTLLHVRNWAGHCWDTPVQFSWRAVQALASNRHVNLVKGTAVETIGDALLQTASDRADATG
jgi:hypothetical protein